MEDTASVAVSRDDPSEEQSTEKLSQVGESPVNEPQTRKRGKNRRRRVKRLPALFHGSHVGRLENAMLRQCEAVASCVQPEFLESLVADSLLVTAGRAGAPNVGSSVSLGDAEPDHPTDPEGARPQAPSKVETGAQVKNPDNVVLRNFDVRLPYSDTVVSLVAREKRDVFLSSGRSFLESLSSSSQSLFEEFAPQSCIQDALARVYHWRKKKPVALAEIRGQLLRELACRVKDLLGFEADPFDPTVGDAVYNDEARQEARVVLAGHPEVQRLLKAYGGLLQFDHSRILAASQWWRFQKGTSTDEHAPLQLTVYPFSTVLQRVPKIRRLRCLRPPLRQAKIQPHLKVTVDVMHVCLTDHYLFGNEDILAQELLRLYEVYCYLVNYQSGEQLTARLRSAIHYSDEVRQRLSVYCPLALYAIARGEAPTEEMKQEVGRAKQALSEWRRTYPQVPNRFKGRRIRRSTMCPTGWTAEDDADDGL